jgi:hypothetical protein
MIVVEGPDGAGKTTLVEYLCRSFNLKQGERQTQNRDDIYKTTREDSWKALHEECMATQPPLVWDRLGPWSDPIYSVHGIPNERECAFTTHEVQFYHAMVRDPQFGTLIVCLPDLNTVLNNVEDTHQLPGVVGRTKAIYNSYRVLFSQDAVRYDYKKKGDIYAVSQAVSVHLRHRHKREKLARDL